MGTSCAAVRARLASWLTWLLPLLWPAAGKPRLRNQRGEARSALGTRRSRAPIVVAALTLLPVLTSRSGFCSPLPLASPQKRQILVTVIEICLPLLFAAILIALRHRVHSISHPNATIYPAESVDELPGFFYRRHPSNPWELAYVPSNSSAVRSIAEAVERALPISIRGERGQATARAWSRLRPAPPRWRGRGTMCSASWVLGQRLCSDSRGEEVSQNSPLLSSLVLQGTGKANEVGKKGIQLDEFRHRQSAFHPGTRNSRTNFYSVKYPRSVPRMPWFLSERQGNGFPV